MAITKTPYAGSTVPFELLFEDRVIRVEETSEYRNWSDTLDVSDFRTTRCTWALVWLGEQGIPPRQLRGDRPTAQIPHEYNADQVRTLEFHEQFAWVDCTNLFSDRYGYSLDPKVDGSYAGFGEPVMWANLIAWEAYQVSLREQARKKLDEEIAKREAERKAEEAKRQVRQAARDAREAQSKAAAEAVFGRIPEKGMTLTVKGFTGSLFWKGVTKYRGKYDARFGLRDAKGTVAWFTVGDLPA